MSISKPSSWAVGGNVLARSMSQILRKVPWNQRAVVETHKKSRFKRLIPCTSTYIRDLDVWIRERYTGVNEIAGLVFPQIVLEIESRIIIRKEPFFDQDRMTAQIDI